MEQFFASFNKVVKEVDKEIQEETGEEYDKNIETDHREKEVDLQRSKLGDIMRVLDKGDSEGKNVEEKLASIYMSMFT